LSMSVAQISGERSVATLTGGTYFGTPEGDAWQIFLSTGFGFGFGYLGKIGAPPVPETYLFQGTAPGKLNLPRPEVPNIGLTAKGSSLLEQPRNELGQFTIKTPGQSAPGFNAVDDFVAQAQANGFEVVAREVSFQTPFGLRRYDLVLRNPLTRATSGIEIKSSMGAMDRWDAAARQQFAADRWINSNGGATAVGGKGPIRIDSTYKILW